MFDKRILYGGIGLAIVLLLFMVVPMWLRSVDHPLTAQAVLDVCTYLDAAVRATLPAPPVGESRAYPGERESGKPVCLLELPPAPSSAVGAPNVWVAVSTERMLSAGGRPQRTDRFVDTWLIEAKASGSEVTPVKGPWRRAAIIREPGRPGKIGLLADDAGVALWFNGQGVDDPAFIAFAEAAARALRAKPTAKDRR